MKPMKRVSMACKWPGDGLHAPRCTGTRSALKGWDVCECAKSNRTISASAPVSSVVSWRVSLRWRDGHMCVMSAIRWTDSSRQRFWWYWGRTELKSGTVEIGFNVRLQCVCVGTPLVGWRHALLWSNKLLCIINGWICSKYGVAHRLDADILI